MMNAMEHIRYLTLKIGPRGSTTEAEADAARYAAHELAEMGVTPSTETFSSARSAYYPFALWSGLNLLATLLFLLDRASLRVRSQAMNAFSYSFRSVPYCS